MGAASTVTGVVGGLMANHANKKGQAAAAAALARAQALIDAVGAPPDLSGKIIYDQFQQAGILTPELENAINLGVSKVSQIEEDPSLRGAQMEALQRMSKVGRTGLTAEDRAAYNLSRQSVQKDLEAKQQQIKNEMEMRGQGGGGSEIAARMLASQSGADRASEEADRISADAAARALQGISQSANMASNVRGQDFSNNEARASAADEFSRFNTTNQQAVQERNIGSKNAAQAANLENKQQLSNMNTSQANQEALRQKEAQRTYWQDKLTYAQAQAAPLSAQAQFESNRGQQNANAISGMASGIGSGFGSLSSYFGKNQTTKTPYEQKGIPYSN